MSRTHSHLRSAAEIISLYGGGTPFAGWLKAYFSQHKKFGSKDRKAVADLCFCYYRLGAAFVNEFIEEQLLIGQFLCRSESVFVADAKPEWKKASAYKLAEKIAFLSTVQTGSFFPFLDEVSAEIDKEEFNRSHLVQPGLFLRIRPGRSDAVLQKLKNAMLSFSVEGDCLRLPINTKIDDVLLVDEEVVVQDKNSQRVLDFPELQTPNKKRQTFYAWDCCAASGGKSILLHDYFPKVQLTVSDVRESILHNLKNRFGRAGIRDYRSFVTDVSSPQFQLQQTFDLLICDAPCSGSGTWGRTPESLRFFPKEKIETYASLQKKIAVNASRQLKNEGLFLYITCSVFQKENEDVVKHIATRANLQLLKQEYFKGYTTKADTLFAALFVKGSSV